MHKPFYVTTNERRVAFNPAMIVRVIEEGNDVLVVSEGSVATNFFAAPSGEGISFEKFCKEWEKALRGED